MNYKKAGWLFLSIILVHLLATLAASLFSESYNNLSVAVRAIMGEMIVLIPVIVFTVMACRATGEGPAKILGLKKIRIGTVFLMALYGLLIIPVTLFLNMVSMLFTENVVTSSIDQVSAYPIVAVMIVAGLYGPLVEEICCRGLIFGGLRKNMSAIAAILLSALSFGLIHLNLNQFVYATGMGIFVALAVEAVGSVWASFIVHMVINTEQMLLMLLVNKVSPDFYSEVAPQFGRKELLMSMPVYLFVGGFCASLAIGVLAWASHHEGRLEVLSKLKETPEGGVRGKAVLTIPYMIAAVLCIVIIVYEELH
jgi:membrane protease YdiL (CAAX protease family)